MTGGRNKVAPPPEARDSGSAPAYRERLTVPASYWVLAVPSVVLLGAEAYIFVDGLIPVLVIVALFLVVAAFLVNWSSATVEVTGAVLRAGKDTVALDATGDVIALDEKQAMALRGPRADPSALVLLRPYLKRAVYVAVTDPAAGVPYWLVATRHPERLAAAITGARVGSAADSPSPRVVTDREGEHGEGS